MAENLYRKVTKEEQEAAWAESRFYFQLEQNTMRNHAHKQGLAQGRAEGRSEGEALKQREIARNMLQESMPKSVIAKITGLSLEEVDAL